MVEIVGDEQVRKKNLDPGSTHQVRVRAKTGDAWGDFSDALSFTTLKPDAKLIEAPSVVPFLPERAHAPARMVCLHHRFGSQQLLPASLHIVCRPL